MSKIALFIFLIVFGYIVYYVINLLIKNRLTEGFITNDLNQKMFMMDEHHLPFNDPNLTNRDAHWFLQTSIMPGKKAYQNLAERNPHKTDFYYVDENSLHLEKADPWTSRPKCTKLSYPNIKDRLTCIPGDHPIRPLIGKLQPYMYDNPELINFYDRPWYRDWRYPRRPIDVRFAVNPKKYCEAFPHVYPCFEYFSKY